MNERQRPRAVLDTDIIFSRVLHELMGRIAAELRLLDLFWSEQLLAEAQRSLVEKKRLPADSARRWVDYLRLSFPSGRIELDPHAPHVANLTRDPADAHVCALVVAAHADYHLCSGNARVTEAARQLDAYLMSREAEGVTQRAGRLALWRVRMRPTSCLSDVRVSFISCAPVRAPR